MCTVLVITRTSLLHVRTKYAISDDFLITYMYVHSCVCDSSKGLTGYSTLEAFCMSFFSSATSSTPLASVISVKNSVNLSGAAEFASVAKVTLPATYLVKVQAAVDVRSDGFYTFCVTSSGQVTVSTCTHTRACACCMCAPCASHCPDTVLRVQLALIENMSDSDCVTLASSTLLNHV